MFNPVGYSFGVFVDYSIGYVTTLAYKVGDTSLMIGVKGMKGRDVSVKFKEYPIPTVDNLKSVVLVAVREEKKKEFLTKKTYVGYPINFTKRLYKIFRHAYNKALVDESYGSA